MSKPPDHYLKIDWAVIPVKPSSKEPVNKNWPALRLTASDLEKYFPTGEENIGVLLGEPSGGLIDIDLDCAEAIELAPAILPPTRTFGRQSKPQSHYLYKVNSPPATQRFSVDGRTLLELRSTGAQTIFPGSKHPKGEAIQFDDDTELVTEMTPQELALRTRVLAVMTLMARHWVSFKGTRQDIAMALSDVLLKTQLAPAIARNVLVQMLTIAEDEERQDRLQAFDSTQTKLEGKETTVGWKLLQDRLPANSYSRVQEWLGDDDEPSQAMSLADILGPQVPSMTQSMALIDGRAYAASQYPDQKGKPQPIIVRDDMTIFSALKDTQDLGRLPFSLNLNLSSLGQERWFANSTQPDPIDVFNEMMRVLDQFMDFDRSFGTQQEMRELAVCYAMGTWFLPAFSTIGYLFANGAAGSGKTKFLEVMSKLCFRARILAGTSTTPAVRERASLGGTICLDDDESLGQKGGERMSLLLTSNRRGSETIMREGQKGNTWANRTVDAFCPFVISAINRPYETLAQRSIIIRIVRSGDAEKTARDVLEPSHWPDGIHQQDIHDSMWKIAIRNLRHIRGYEDKAVKLARLSGRPLDPWRSILAMALWLEIPGLHDRMNSLMQSYHHQKPDLEGENEIAVLLRSIELLLQRRGIDPLIFSASDLQAPMSQIVEDEAIHSGDDQYLDNAKIGKILNQLGIQHTQRTSGRKQRMLSREELEKLMKNYGVFSREHEFKKAG